MKNNMNELVKTAVDIKHPYDFYDFFGYIFPGTIFLFLMFWGSRLDSIEYINSLIKFLEEMKVNSFIAGLLLLFFLIVIIYVLGHLIATISAIFFDIVLNKNVLLYPYRKLLNIAVNESAVKDFYKKEFFKFVFIVFNLITFIILIHIFFSSGLLTEKKVALIEIFNLPLWLLISVCCIILTIIIWILKIILVIIAEKRQINNNLSQGLGKKEKLFLLIFKGLGWPFDFLAKRVFEDLTFSSSFTDTFVAEYKRIVNKYFKMNVDEIKTENYWLPSIYLTHYHPELRTVIKKFMSLYGFARNMSMTFFLIFYLLIFLKLLGHNIKNTVMFISFIGAYVFLFRYYYLYVRYYSKYIIRAFVYTFKTEEMNN